MTPNFASAFRLLVNCWRAPACARHYSLRDRWRVDCSVCCACWIFSSRLR
ncbi:hypothetical protein KCP76_04125 [Salmonella enterica subsp. enterica serovar Weltevreden]|nr:hypothetical protein KCP76_04125 [Salmonella enterica subsp. enterica serovar Weltevreden]